MAAVAPSTPPRPVRPRTATVRRPAPYPDLRVVTPVRHARRYVTILSVVAALGVFGVVSLNALAAESAFEAKTLESEVRDLSARYDELTAEVASLEAPDRVRRIAVERLGMVPVENPGVLTLEDAPPFSARGRVVASNGFGGIRGDAPGHGP
jgi:cell division protein FtsL